MTRMRWAEVRNGRKIRGWAARPGLAAAIGIVVMGAVWAPVLDGVATDSGRERSTSEMMVTPATASEPVVAIEPSQTLVTRPVVVLYGDSLAWEAREPFAAAFSGRSGVRVEARTFGGTATCDWIDDMRADAESLRPGAVVVEFSGNAFTPCMQDIAGQPLSGDAFLARYRADAETVMQIFEPIGTRVYFAGSPLPGPALIPDSNGARLNAMYAEVAATHPAAAEFVDAGAAVLDDGRWTNTLPCLPAEPCEGGTGADGRPVNVVRSPDTVHFCPVSGAARAGVTGTCPVWSSGAMRYGTAMAAPVVEAIGRGRA